MEKIERQICRLHIPTGKIFRFTEKFNNELHMYRTLNRWNYLSTLAVEGRSHAVTWVYYIDI
jgi:hypothetical protein